MKKLQQGTVVPPPRYNTGLASGVLSAALQLTEEDDTFVSKLKRSPAMILSGERVGQSAPTDMIGLGQYTHIAMGTKPHLPASANPFIDSNLAHIASRQRDVSGSFCMHSSPRLLPRNLSIFSHLLIFT